MSLPNRIEIDPHNYQNKYDFQKDVARTVTLLGDLKYNCSITYDCEGVAIIEFDHTDIEIAELYPAWLTEAELESLHEIPGE